jgi:uncharacterized heparinase superfamily protein
LHAKLLGTDISEVDFLHALKGDFPNKQVFLGTLSFGEDSRFFIDLACREEFVSGIRKASPGIKIRTVTAADQVCDHVFDLLGSGSTPLGEQIDWHVDFKTGHRFDPEKYYADVRSAPYPGGYDIKVPWELSRCQHFAWLGQAYWFTEDEKYVREFVAQVSDWIEHNPPQFGVNWACAMDVAIRAVNWLWGYYFFKESAALKDKFLLAFFKSMLAHGRHIMNNLEWSDALTSNHYLSDIVGLVYLGVLLPEFKEAPHWREFGLQELEKEMFKQVYADGVDFEASTSYHRLVTEMFLSATILARLNGHTFSPAYMERLEKMVEFVMYLTKPDGTVPLIGDNDNGRLHRLKVWEAPEREWVDHRYLLAIGAVLFEREDFALAAGNQWEEAIWLLGKRAITFRDRLEVSGSNVSLTLKSRGFSDAGIYILRDQDLYMAITTGAAGQNGRGGHAHSDALSFELCVDRVTWIVDPGMVVYTADYDMRNRFRSTAFHNTVQVDGEDVNLFNPRKLFSMDKVNEATVLKWADKSTEVVFEAEHRGYSRFEAPVIHRRRIRLDKSNREWLLRDLFLGEGRHKLEFFLHLAPDVCVIKEDDQSALLWAGPENALLVRCLNPGVNMCTEPGQLARSYGQVIPTIVLTYRVMDANLPYSWDFVFTQVTIEEVNNVYQ